MTRGLFIKELSTFVRRPQTSWSDVGWPSVITAKQAIKSSGENRWEKKKSRGVGDNFTELLKQIRSQRGKLWGCSSEVSKVTNTSCLFRCELTPILIGNMKMRFLLPLSGNSFPDANLDNPNTSCKPVPSRVTACFTKLDQGGFSNAVQPQRLR